VTIWCVDVTCYRGDDWPTIGCFSATAGLIESNV